MRLSSSYRPPVSSWWCVVSAQRCERGPPMAEAHGRSGMPPPDFERVESFEPLPGDESGEVEWITNEVLLVRLSDPNTMRVRWDVGEGPLGRFGLSNPRVRLTIWRW